MLYKANVPMMLKSEYIKAGQEFEATAEDMANYDQADFSPVDTTPVVPAPEEPEKPVADMNLEELKEKAKALGLSASGSKGAILERITLHLETPSEETDEQINS